MVHLDELQEKYAAKGLTVMAITNEGRSLVDAFVAKTSAKHAIVIESTDSAKTFDIKGYPTSYLIGPDGKILAAGHPSEEQIEAALLLVRLAPELPKALASIEPSIKKEKWADARAKTQKLIDGGTLTADEDKDAATKLVTWIDWLAQSGVDGAKSAGEKGRWYEAAELLEGVKADFKGLPQALEADTQLRAILADKDKKDDVTSYGKLLKAKATQREKDLKPKEALPLFKPIASKFENTRAGKAAAEIVRQLEADAGK